MRSKPSVTLFILCFSLVAVSSCKRCYQCVVIDQNNELVFGYKEICERPNALEEYEEICKDGVKDAREQIAEDDDSTEYRCNCGSDIDF
ncbi:MAG: hypothetical protein Salg2KO_22780 [Salibacteraceae bacterium]